MSVRAPRTVLHLWVCLALAACGVAETAPHAGQGQETEHAHVFEAPYHGVGPRGGEVLMLADGELRVEWLHNGHWGSLSLHAYDASMEPRALGEPPALSLLVDEEQDSCVATRENYEGEVDGGWHFEHDGLLGQPEDCRLHIPLGEARLEAEIEPRYVVHHGRGHEGTPHGGHVIVLGDGEAHLEFKQDGHLGTVSVYAFDEGKNPCEFDDAPILNVLFEDEPLQLVGGPEDWEGNNDGGRHFEHDALLGEPEGGRFRVRIGGRIYTPAFVHSHSHDASESDTRRPVTLPLAHGPQGGHVVALAGADALVEYYHDEHWGTLCLYLYDASLRPREFDEAPILNARVEDEPVQMKAGRIDFDGKRDGGWHFEHDALLGEPEGARFRLRVRGETHTPAFEHASHSHGAHPGDD